MGDTVEKFNAVIYSHKELAEALPQASETFIKDYMLNKQNLETVADGNDESIENINDEIADIVEQANDNAQIESAIPVQERQSFYTSVQRSSYTAITYDFVEARSGCTITLDSNANHSDEIIVANGDGTKIKVNASPLSIKYTSTSNKLFIKSKGTSLHFQMFVDGNEKYWRIR